MTDKGRALSCLDSPELLKNFGVNLHGWYVESAEGVLASFADDPEETLELSELMDEAAAG